eukprot:scaffold5191_cov60-Skeletonema_menzelii.AAC.1
MPLSSAAAAALKKLASGSTTTSSTEHIIILGGEISGLSTARHLLGYASTSEHQNHVHRSQLRR